MANTLGAENSKSKPHMELFSKKYALILFYHKILLTLI